MNVPRNSYLFDSLREPPAVRQRERELDTDARLVEVLHFRLARRSPTEMLRAVQAMQKGVALKVTCDVDKGCCSLEVRSDTFAELRRLMLVEVIS